MTTKNPPTPRVIPLLLTAFLISIPAQAQYGGGTGEPNDPYLIYTPEQMNAIGADPNHWDKHFKLMADIDLSEYGETAFNMIGYEQRAANPGKGARPFTGVFDGNGHTISHFARRSSDTKGVGLFGCVAGPDAEIRNLGMIDPNVIAENEAFSSYAGSLVGYLSAGTLTACYVRGGSVTGVFGTGGLAGYNSSGTIVNSYAMTDVSGNSAVGGLVGSSGATTRSGTTVGGAVISCHATGRVTGDSYVGGLVGGNLGRIKDSYSTGAVFGTGWVGGFVGPNSGELTNCQSSGDVHGTEYVGGLAGHNHGAIVNCHSTANVTAEEFLAGGLVGLNEETITNCHATGNVTGTDAVGGLVGLNVGGTITDCNSTGTAKGKRNVGGLAGSNRGTIVICRSDSTVAGERGIGGLVGTNDGAITNSHASGSVSGDLLVGGLTGEHHGEITRCYSTGSIYGTQWVGGLVGSSGAEVRDCYSTGDVYGAENVGGLAGSHAWRTITNCYSTGDVTGDNLAGGLVGHNRASIVNCYSTGPVYATKDVNAPQASEGNPFARIRPGVPAPPGPPDAFAGGLVGSNEGSITNCYSIGAVPRTRGGAGLVGTGELWRVVGSFWDIETSGQTASAGGVGRSTVQMQTATTFLGWGVFASAGAWTIDEGSDYPRLSWENVPGTVIDFAYPTGAGTPEDPYQINTPEELFLVGWHPSEWAKHFEVMTDIDLSGYAGTIFIIGDSKTPFAGTFDGHGYRISDFSYRTEDRYFAGLFGYVADPNAAIRNLGLIDPNVSATTAANVGSLVGHLAEGTIAGCYAEGGTILGGSCVGGLVGQNGALKYPVHLRGSVVDCYCTSTVTGSAWVGGLVGRNEKGTITTCCARGAITGHRSAGGLVGMNERESVIVDCYSTGAVTGDEQIGGLVGWSYGTITNCYSLGSVLGNREVGGLLGKGSALPVSTVASFWNMETSGQTASAAGIGLGTAEMQTANIFLSVGWDFVGETANGTEDTWWIEEGRDYPRLWWEAPHD